MGWEKSFLDRGEVKGLFAEQTMGSGSRHGAVQGRISRTSPVADHLHSTVDHPSRSETRSTPYSEITSKHFRSHPLVYTY